MEAELNGARLNYDDTNGWDTSELPTEAQYFLQHDQRIRDATSYKWTVNNLWEAAEGVLGLFCINQKFN
jgi:hypothetical protein